MGDNLDQPRLADLLASHTTALHTYVSYRLDRDLRQREPVSDIVQSALREVLANPGCFTYQGPEALRAFLIQAVEHKIANKRRHWDTLKRSGSLEPREDIDGLQATQGQTPSDALVQKEALERLKASLDRLTEEDRALITMRRIASLPLKEISAALGLPVSTVRSRLGSIMTILSRELGHLREPDEGMIEPPA